MPFPLCQLLKNRQPCRFLSLGFWLCQNPTKGDRGRHPWRAQESASMRILEHGVCGMAANPTRPIPPPSVAGTLRGDTERGWRCGGSWPVVERVTYWFLRPAQKPKLKPQRGLSTAPSTSPSRRLGELRVRKPARNVLVFAPRAKTQAQAAARLEHGPFDFPKLPPRRAGGAAYWGFGFAKTPSPPSGMEAGWWALRGLSIKKARPLPRLLPIC